MNLATKRMQNIKSQGGWTFWSMMFTLGVLGFFAYVGMQLVPVYSANSNVKNAMKVSLKNIDVRKATRSQVIKGVKAQLYLDGGSKFIDYKNDLEVVRDRNKLTVSINYQRIVPLFSNISILADFNPILECSLNGGCKEATTLRTLKK